ncbi:hypothetical protein PITCH_A720004 [uncultured Desulfobacterium sp.]|uniref:Uncharacterized protein n=1 Tax=uncultured Desulfobacterium sp. TaxID=201089 RepID=A0A445N1T6_9BACT|nr:hypothetical protein PITCH_A720004 [uncultured Desulfobacterium sp.]
MPPGLEPAALHASFLLICCSCVDSFFKYRKSVLEPPCLLF